MTLIARIPYDACPLCDGQDATVVRSADCSRHPHWQPGLPPSMRWVRCQRCAHVFTDGYFGPDGLALLFGQTRGVLVPGHEASTARQVSAVIVESVTGLLAAGPGAPASIDRAGRWLDVGCGGGGLVTTAAEYGYDAVGIDTREVCVTRLREYGFAAHQGDFLAYAPPEGAPFDVVSMADVLEHIPFPRPALRRAHELLRPGGLLFVSLPNLECFLWKHMDALQQNPYWSEIEHYHNFGRRRLYDLLRESGFTPCRYGISHRYIACMEVIARRS